LNKDGLTFTGSHSKNTSGNNLEQTITKNVDLNVLSLFVLHPNM
jgi:hypothetical protein